MGWWDARGAAVGCFQPSAPIAPQACWAHKGIWDEDYDTCKVARCHVKEMACRKTVSPQRAMSNAEKLSHPLLWDTGKGDEGKCYSALEKKVCGNGGKTLSPEPRPPPSNLIIIC